MQDHPDHDLHDQAARSALPPIADGEKLAEAGSPLPPVSVGPSSAVASSRASGVEQAEIEMIRRICAGEGELFVELVKPYQKMVYGMAISIVKNEHDAEEVAQEALFKAF